MHVSSHDLFVAPNGRDSWSGSLAAPRADGGDGPLATVERARDAVRRLRQDAAHLGPLTVWIRGGRYRLARPLQFGPQDSGPTTYAAYPGEVVVFDGGRRVEGWEDGTVNGVRVWVADVSELLRDHRREFRSLFVNGRRARRPRLPKAGFFWMAEAPHVPDGHLFDGTDRFRARPGDVQEWHNLNGVDVVVVHYWVEERMPIWEFEPETGWVRSLHRSIFVLKDDVRNCPARYYVENVFEALSEPGEWYLDLSWSRTEGKIYYVPRAGETPENSTVVLPYAHHLLRICGDLDSGRHVSGLTFRGLTFEHTDWTEASHYGKWEEFSAPPEQLRDRDSYRQFPVRSGGDPYQEYAAMPQAAFHVSAAVMFRCAQHCALEDCRISHIGGYGIDLQEGCFANRIVGNTLSDLGGGGIQLDGADADGKTAWRCGNNRLTDNHIHDGGHAYPSACGIALLHSFGNTVSHNHIHDFLHTGISCGWMWNFGDSVSRDNRIEKNHIHDLGKGVLSDMGGIQTLGVQPGTVLRGNLIHDIEKANYGGWAIYPDQASSHILIENNVCYNTASTVFHQQHGRENIVRNNIWAFGGEGIVQLNHGGDHNAFTFERNIILSDGQPVHAGGEWHSLRDPRLVSDLNLLWDLAGEPFGLDDGTRLALADLREVGLEVHSLVADPGFRDARGYDFTLAEDSPATAIGFKPIDLSDVGPRAPEQRE